MFPPFSGRTVNSFYLQVCTLHSFVFFFGPSCQLVTCLLFIAIQTLMLWVLFLVPGIDIGEISANICVYRISILVSPVSRHFPLSFGLQFNLQQTFCSWNSSRSVFHFLGKLTLFACSLASALPDFIAALLFMFYAVYLRI